MEKINSDYAIALKNEVRDSQTDCEKLKDILYKLGNGVAQKIAEKYFLVEKTVNTPMGETHTGYHISDSKVVVISTKDDYEAFGRGIASVFPVVSRGYMDFAGKRGEEALKSPLREINLPKEDDVEAIIIAKSVLATGCTAISLAKRAVEEYNPQYLIIASVFYSEIGVTDVKNDCRNAEIFSIGAPDELRKDGMLVPGFGDLDKRLNGTI